MLRLPISRRPTPAMNAPALILSIICLILLDSCAVAPARIRRVSRPERAEAHALLTQALQSPNDAASSHALAHLVELWKQRDLPVRAEIAPPDGQAGVRYRVQFADAGHGGYLLDYFDEISPAADYEVRHLKHHRRAGAGAPLTALRENRRSTTEERYYPPEVITRPLTAVAVPGPLRGGAHAVRIELLCPMVHDTVVLNGKRLPLAADFSVPWAAALARTGGLKRSGVLDVLTRTPRRQPQLYLMEPYDRRKEPLIMIHGLLSTPLVWADVSNELWADDEIRRRYQIWHFLYNTSAPALYSTRQLRMQLRELRKLLDPEGDDPAMRRTTLLTHSMGGLVGKALAMEPGDAFWKAAFTVPHESLQLSAADRAVLQEAFEWEPDRTIHRIIFIAVPHRGSEFANNPIGRIGSWIAAPPQPFQVFYERISAANPGAFTPAYAELGRGKLDSVNSLSPQQPTLQILLNLPYPRPVKQHSIIGNRGKPGPLELSSDGVVPYTSSHLDGVESELIVPSGHSAMRHPLTVAEIKRILKL
jgi:pimeloyl-ACP methyl ester carboxylesterase